MEEKQGGKNEGGNLKMKNFNQYMYDFERFGLTPTKIGAQIFGLSSKCPRILTVTMPKSGTNLLQRILLLHPYLSRSFLNTLGNRNLSKWSDPERLLSSIKNGKIISTHFDYDQKLASLIHDKLQYKVLLMVRDPRDALISDMYYILSWPGHPLKGYFKDLPNDETRLSHLITGGINFNGIRKQILRFSEWQNCAFTIKFEDAVGASGGGDDNKQSEMINALYEYLGMPLKPSQLKKISESSRSSNTQTFRTGKIGNWRFEYSEQLKEKFKNEAGDLLIALGYESDYNW